MSGKHRLAIIDPKRCKPHKCAQECKRYCPVNSQGKLCVTVTRKDKKADIAEGLCTGCGICPKKCPFDAIKIINLPKEISPEETSHRYGENTFQLFRLPIPKTGHVLGLVGTNGVGKTTAIRVLSGKGINIHRVRQKPTQDMEDFLKTHPQIPNLGDWNNPPDINDLIRHYRGSELQNYFTLLKDQKLQTVVKPQDVRSLAKQLPATVGEYISGPLAEDLELTPLADRQVTDLSGGELQRLAIGITAQRPANVYIFDEPSNFLDVRQRLRMASVIRSLVRDDAYVIVIEHDLAVLDYLSDMVSCLYGTPGAFGVVTAPMSVREGINVFLDGYIPAENMRFRPEPLVFRITDTLEEATGGEGHHMEYPRMEHRVEGFHLTIEPGGFRGSQITVLLGQNGTGKTTFIRQLASQEWNLVVSYKPQHISAKSEGTVTQLLHKNIPAAMADPVFQSDVLRPMKIPELYDCMVPTLSGGQLQRLAITLCLGTPADIYLVDEPSADLDSEQRVETARVLKRHILHSKKAAFVVEHDIMMALYLADQVVVFSGTPSQECTAAAPRLPVDGFNQFLEQLGVTFRSDHNNHRPRINKPGSARDTEQKKAKQYFVTD